MTALSTTSIRLTDDRRNEESSIEVTTELAALIEYAHSWALLGLRSDHCTLTFSSMLAAMVAGRDPLCEWLRRHLALRGVPAQLVTRGRPVQRQSMPDTLFTTYSFRQAQAEAGALAAGAPLDVRHFMAAYAVIKDYHREEFLRLRIDRRAWCLELAERLQKESVTERDRWATYADRAPAVLVPGFDADLPGGVDLLGVGREVEAFAMLIAGRDTRTPLSIGVFGAWGSGKTYFMRELEERVAALATGAEPGSRHLRRIAQVRFNAWHYSEANVVASLVDQILRNLRFDATETEQVLAERQREALHDIGAAEQLRVQRQTDLEQAVEAERLQQARLDRLEDEVDAAMGEKATELAAAHAAIAQSTARILRITEEQARAVAAASARSSAVPGAVLESVLASDTELGQIGASLRQASERVRWVGLNTANIVWGAVILALTTVAALTVSRLGNARFAVAVTGALAAVAPAARAGLKLLQDLAEKGRLYEEAVQRRIAEARQRIEAAADSAREVEEARRLAGEEAATGLRAEIAALEEQSAVGHLERREIGERRQEAQAAVAAAAAEVAERQRRLDSLSRGALLEELIDDLTTTDAYRSELGTLARARSHFERLSERMTLARTEFAEKRSTQPPVLDRIVLYIDDLDRCPEANVIQVLRAVHLLLAFDLFVCVVAVDPRWVIQCLRSSPGLVSSAAGQSTDLEELGGAATPADYLEKIFQVPLWLRPVPTAQRAALVGALLEDHLDPRGEGIKVDKRELAFLPRLAPLLDGNPRALKRFVNTYRLVKAALSDVELEYYARDVPYRVCMTQLAVLATQRSRARTLVRLADSAAHDLLVNDWLNDIERGDSEAATLARDLRAALMPELSRLTLGTFAVWLERTRRYSFYL